MKPKKITQKDILYLSISMFVIVAAWIGFSLFHTFVTSTISEDLQMKIIPIDPTFDTATIQVLKARKKVAPSFQSNEKSTVATPAQLSTENNDQTIASPAGETVPTEIPSSNP